MGEVKNLGALSSNPLLNCLTMVKLLATLDFTFLNCKMEIIRVHLSLANF